MRAALEPSGLAGMITVLAGAHIRVCAVFERPLAPQMMHGECGLLRHGAASSMAWSLVVNTRRGHQGAEPSDAVLRGGGRAAGRLRAALLSMPLLPSCSCAPSDAVLREGGGGGGRWLHGRLTGWMLAAGDARAAPWARRRSAESWLSWTRVVPRATLASLRGRRAHAPDVAGRPGHVVHRLVWLVSMIVGTGLRRF